MPLSRYQLKILDPTHSPFSMMIQGQLKKAFPLIRIALDDFGDPTLDAVDWATHEADLRAFTQTRKGLLIQLTTVPLATVDNPLPQPVRKFFVNSRMQVSAPVLTFDAFDQTKLDAPLGLAVDEPTFNVIGGFQGNPQVFGWRLTILTHPLPAMVGRVITVADQAVRDFWDAQGAPVVGATTFYHLTQFAAAQT